MNILLDKDGRIKATSLGCGFAPMDGESTVEFEFPEDFDTGWQGNYRIVQGALVYDPLPEPEPEVQAPDLIAELYKRLEEQEDALVELAGMIAGGAE